jgi:electron transfer flavoprotein beta subunit
MGADSGVHVLDESIAGSDAPATSLVLAAAVRKVGADIGPVDLVVCGMASTDGTMGVVPAMLAERLGLPQLTYANEVTVDDSSGTFRVEAVAPLVVSVTDQINEPRYPSFKGIMAAKKKPVQTWSLSDVGVDPSEVGLSAAWTAVVSAEARPPRSAGTVVTDEGDGGTRLAEYLVEKKFV